MISRFLRKLKKNLRYFIRDWLVNEKVRRDIEVEDVSLIASDCIGGVIYKDLHRRMDSPTVNMFFSASDFIKFCKNIDYYLEQTIVYDEAANGAEEYPIGRIDDIRLHLVHYNSIAEASEKWEIRKKRIHRDSMYVMMNDRNGCTEKEIAEFDALPFQHKVIFTHKPYPQYKSAYCISGSEQDDFIKVTTAYVNGWSVKRRYDDFDLAAWINRGVLQQRK